MNNLLKEIFCAKASTETNIPIYINAPAEIILYIID